MGCEAFSSMSDASGCNIRRVVSAMSQRRTNTIVTSRTESPQGEGTLTRSCLFSHVKRAMVSTTNTTDHNALATRYILNLGLGHCSMPPPITQ